MEILRTGMADPEGARGVVVVIDVIRAFTVAAYALAGGARALWLVRDVEDAFALRHHAPDALLAGEVGGRLIPGFDLNNSPAAMARAYVRGRVIIQRTGAGTQGATRATNAAHLLMCSLVNARATAGLARRLAARDGERITLFPTDSGRDLAACEDVICADYLEALLRDAGDAAATLDRGLQHLRTCGRLDYFQAGESDFPPEDVPAFMAVDRFDFGMPGMRKECEGVSYVEVTRENLETPG